MIDHLELLVSDVERSAAFYQSALAPIGYELRVPAPSPAIGFGTAADRLDFWLRAGTPSMPPPHYAFGCATRDQVKRAHAAALAAGGADAGVPALITRIHPSYFAGFVKDPDGHHVEFVCHAAE